MRKIIYAENVSLDGYIEDQDGKIGWTAPSEQLHLHFNEREQEMDTHLYGRKIYEIMQYWEDADQDPDIPNYMKEYTWLWQKQTKIVFSTTMDQVKDGYELRNSVDPDEIRLWKQSAGKNMMVGGASLASSFMHHKLLDEVHLYILPLLLGGGKPMFPAGKERDLKFMESQTFPDGVVMLKYKLKK